VKEKLMTKKQLQALEEFNTASENRKFYRSFSLNTKCKPNLNARKVKKVNIMTAGGIDVA
jgi:hypothetical protein